jgi:beta-galactosidase GanA
MRSLGFNYVKLWAVWNCIERERGKFDFADLDALADLAEESGLRVVINFIPEGAPYWTFDGDRGNLYQTADGQAVEYGGPANIPSAGWPGRCMDDPDFSALAMGFIETTARHFADRKGIIAFDVWNEPHLEPMYDFRSNMLCYCAHSKKEFLHWLEHKYGSLKALGDAWYREYGDWSRVEPPVRFGTWADMLDWRKFWLDNMSRWLGQRVEACRRGAPNVKVQTHVAYSGILGNKLSGGLGNELGDEFALARKVDIFGLSSFPKWLMGEQHYFRHFLHNEMVAEASGDIPFYQVELQGGAGKPGLLGGEVPSAEDIRVWNYNTVAAGGRGSVYWQYAPEPSGIESPGFGLTGFKGENTPRSLSAARCAAELNISALDGARRARATNAVYVSRKSDLLCFASERREEMYAGGLSGAFKAAYDRCIPIRFFHEDNLDSLSSSGIKVLYLPMTLVIGEKEAAAFESFAAGGGTLVSEACPGLYDEAGLLEQSCAALERLFGLGHVEVQGIKDWGEVAAVLNDGKSFSGRFYRQITAPKAESAVLARFADGEPAAIERPMGKGRTVWIGTYPSYHYEQCGDSGTGDFIAGFFDKSGYLEVRSIEVQAVQAEGGASEGAAAYPGAPVFRLLETEDEHILVFVNHGGNPVDITVQLMGESSPAVVHLEATDGKVVRVPRP